MALTTQETLQIVLHEGAGAEPLDRGTRTAAITALLEKGFSVRRTVEGEPGVTQERGTLLVLGRFSRERISERQKTEGMVVFKDITGLDAPAIGREAEAVREATGAARHGEWLPWFPVIDYDRCTNCMQCLSFCLFGVYGVDEQHRIQAQNHDNCKTNCPACSRVCPEAAIIFPKYKSGPINGDVVTDADAGKEKMKVDISSLLGGDVYAALRTRSVQAKERFSRERDEKTALQERQKCLSKLLQDVPPEVLMALPSAEEITRRAEEAKARATAALAANAKP